MKSLFQVTNKHLKLFFSVLFFGGIWGLLEATLGTFLHLDIIGKAGMYACSTTIMLPIAYYLIGLCYKHNGNLRCIAYMGLVASIIKMSLFLFKLFIPFAGTQSILMPAMCILIESLSFMGAIAIMRPTKILSPKSLFTVAMASTSYLLTFVLLKYAMGDYAANAVLGQIEKRVFMYNFVMLAYVAISGSIAYGIYQLALKLNWKFSKEKISQIIASPVTASVAVCLALVATAFMPLLG